MKGWDKKAIKKLKELLARTDLNDNDRSAFEDMRTQYLDPNLRFFTERQRQYIRSVYDHYFNPKKDGDDPKFIQWVETTLANTNTPERMRELLQDLAKQYRDPSRMRFTDGQKALIKKLDKQLDDRADQAKLCTRLQAMLTAGTAPESSINFCQDVIDQFGRTGHWSEIQLEHIEKILANNEDPE